MTIEQFTNKVDGIINDFQNGIITSNEFRNLVLDLLLLISKPVLQK